MKARLDAGSGWTWRDGDSAYHDYLAVRIGPGPRALKLYPEGGRYVIQTRWGMPDAALRALVGERLLPLLDASDPRADEGFD